MTLSVVYRERGGARGSNDQELPEHIGQATPIAVRVLSGIMYGVVRVLHRATAEGFENLPEKGAYLLVANHPPCTGSGEFFSFMSLWARRFGGTRPLTGFVHTAGYAVWPLSWLFGQIGAIPSTYAAGEAALAQGVPILVLPGGDHEALEPFWIRHADFNGREGFLRIARKAGVPIVPMGITGKGAPVVWRSQLLASLFVWPRLFGVKRYGLSLLGVIGAVVIMLTVPLAWHWRALIVVAWLASPFPMLSWVPTTVRIKIGKPMSNEVSTKDVEAAIDLLLA